MSYANRFGAGTFYDTPYKAMTCLHAVCNLHPGTIESNMDRCMKMRAIAMFNNDNQLDACFSPDEALIHRCTVYTEVDTLNSARGQCNHCNGLDSALIELLVYCTLKPTAQV